MMLTKVDEHPDYLVVKYVYNQLDNAEKAHFIKAITEDRRLQVDCLQLLETVRLIDKTIENLPQPSDRCLNKIFDHAKKQTSAIEK